MTIDEIKAELEKAEKTDGVLLLTNYKTSKGGCVDYVIKMLDKQGYTRLVQESYDLINKDVNKYIRELRPEDAEPMEWIEAVSEVIDAFKTHLDSKKEASEFKTTLFKNSVKQGRFLYKKEEVESGNITTIGIQGVEILSYTNHTPDVDIFNVAKGNVPKYKHIIKQALPVGKYGAQVSLTADKVDLVKAAALP